MRRTWLMMAACVVLLSGLCLAAWIALTAQQPESGETVIGQVYVIDPADSKLYRRDLQMFGGKAMLLVDDLGRWFAGLWHGRRLAGTISVLSLAVAALLFALGRNGDKAGENDEKQDGKS
jgi:hypothetical protein